MNFSRTAILFLILISANLTAEDYSGRITNDLDEEVGFATVVIAELDLLVTTESDGTFTLTGVELGSHTVQVIASGYIEWSGTVEFTDDLVTIVIQREVIEMGAITVIAEVTGHKELDSRADEVRSAIDIVYRARGKAAGEILRQLARRDIELSEGTASVQIEGHEIQYHLNRVLSIDEPINVPQDEIGILKNITEFSR